jgi:hypothetical protein
MKREDDNLFHCNSMTQSDKNVSRLVKQAGDSSKPSRAFTESLANNALSELKQSGADRNQEEKGIIAKLDWRKRAIGWAAMIAVVCSAGFGILVSYLIKINSFFAMIVLTVMLANWLVYIGGLIL